MSAMTELLRANPLLPYELDPENPFMRGLRDTTPRRPGTPPAAQSPLMAALWAQMPKGAQPPAAPPGPTEPEPPAVTGRENYPRSGAPYAPTPFNFNVSTPPPRPADEAYNAALENSLPIQLLRRGGTEGRYAPMVGNGRLSVTPPARPEGDSGFRPLGNPLENGGSIFGGRPLSGPGAARAGGASGSWEADAPAGSPPEPAAPTSAIPNAQAAQARAGGGAPRRAGGGGGGGKVLTQSATATPGAPAQPQQEQAAQTAPASPADARLAELDAQLKEYRDQIKTLRGDPDYGPLATQMRERAATFLPNAMAAAVLGMGPESAKPLAQLAAGQAQQAISPMKIEGGQIDAAGNVQLDPGYRRQKQLEALRDDYAALEKIKQSTLDRQTQLEAQAHQRNIENQFRLLHAQAEQDRVNMERERIADRRAQQATANAQLKAGLIKEWEDPQTGRKIFINLATGQRFDPAASAPGAGGPGGAPGVQTYPQRMNPHATVSEQQAGYATEMMTNQRGRMVPGYEKPGPLEAFARSVGGGTDLGEATANMFSSGKRQQTRQAQEGFVENAILLATGLSATAGERRVKAMEILPNYFDKPATVAAKALVIQEYVQAAKRRTGRAWTQGQEDAFRGAFPELYNPDGSMKQIPITPEVRALANQMQFNITNAPGGGTGGASASFGGAQPTPMPGVTDPRAAQVQREIQERQRSGRWQ